MSLPAVGQPLNGGGATDPNWSRWFSFVNQTLAQLSTATTTPTESSPTTINQGNGIQVTGNPSGGYTISLRTVADSGTGTFKLLTRDGYGRLSGTEDGTAADVPYDPTTSGLTATDAQAAIDELAAEKLDDAPSDGSTYGRKDGAWEIVTGGGGSGDVVGPASATDSHVALFDGTTGKQIKDGGALATIATTGDVGDLTGFPGGTSNFLRADGTFASPSGGGGGSVAWTLVNSWDFSISGAVANIEADLTGYNEVLVVVSDVTLTASGYRGCQFSANAGSTWATSYDLFSSTGVRSTSSLNNAALHGTATTSTRSGTGQGSLLTNCEAPFRGNEDLTGSMFLIPDFGSGNKPNRIKVGGWTGAGATTNMSAGKVRIYAR